jgi:hypothetical protein
MRRLIPTIVFIVVTAGVFLYFSQQEYVEVKVEVPELTFKQVAEVAEEGFEDVEETTPDTLETSGALDTPETPTTSFNLAIPWTSQAPHAVWDARDQDACEEASIYMAHLYFEGVSSGLFDPATADTAIQDLVDYEMQQFGFFESTTAEQVVELVESYYGYSTQLIQDPTVDQIKGAVLNGYPVVVPMAGQVLANPFFTPPGPEYHMLVVKGFTEEGFITNDPGTKRGENWLYEYDHFMNSIHDYVEGDMLSGQKVVIVIQK